MNRNELYDKFKTKKQIQSLKKKLALKRSVEQGDSVWRPKERTESI